MTDKNKELFSEYKAKLNKSLEKRQIETDLNDNEYLANALNNAMSFLDSRDEYINQYVLSIWDKHESPAKYHFDICPIEQYFRNSFEYLLNNKEPYYYTPIFYGTHEQCRKKADKIQAVANNAHSEELGKELAKILLEL